MSLPDTTVKGVTFLHDMIISKNSIVLWPFEDLKRINHIDIAIKAATLLPY